MLKQDMNCQMWIVCGQLWLHTNEVEEKEMNSWEMTESGTPFYKCLGNSFVDPRPLWGMYWRYRTTLIRVHQGEDRNWLLVELSQLYMDREDPFEPVEECMIKMGGLECEILTLLGKHEHGVEQIRVLVDESDDFIGGEGQEQPHFADVLELPPGLAEDPQGGDEAAPMEFIEAEEFPEEQVYLDDDFVITKNSRILDLRTACHWLGVSQADSKTRLFERVKRAHRNSLRRSAVELANAEYERGAQVAVEIPGPRRQPSARERALHNLTHIPYRDWCQFCIGTRARGDYQHSVADPEAALERGQTNHTS